MKLDELLEKIKKLEAEVEEMKVEQDKTPEQRIEEKLDELIKAVKNIRTIEYVYYGNLGYNYGNIEYNPYSSNKKYKISSPWYSYDIKH